MDGQSARGVIAPEELSMLSRAFMRMSVEMALIGEGERTDAAARLIRLFQAGEQGEDALVRRAVAATRAEQNRAAEAA